MGARLKGAKTLGNANPLSPSHICASCRRTIISQRRSASTATASESTDQIVPPLPPQSQDRPTESSSSATVPNPYYAVNCSVVLSRPPILTRDLTPFESAYFLYQRRLNERTALPFTRYFYYKKGTPADLEWKRKQRERVTPAREIGKYNAYSKEGWNDEILVGTKEAERETQVESLLRDAEDTAEPEGEENDGITAHVTRKKAEIERPESRRTKADQDGDLRSLNRLLERALYLLVKDNEGRWVFPTGRIEGKEGLHKAAERILTQGAGQNMNTWVVGNVPVGHFVQDYYKPIEQKDDQSLTLGQKTFFMKGRIMAGQADVAASKLGLTDFRWLAKEEIQKLVSAKYWSMTQDMLTVR